MKPWVLSVFFLATALLTGPFALAAEEGEEEPEYYAEYGTQDLEQDPGIVALSGEIRIKKGDFELVVPNGGVVLWVDSERWREFQKSLGGISSDGEGDAAGGLAADDVLGPIIHEIYAEGDVTLKRGVQFVRAGKLYYNFAANRALILDAKIVYRHEDPDTGTRIPLTLRAAKIRQLSRTKLVAGPAQLTTSAFAVPAYEIELDEVAIEKDDLFAGITSGASVFRLSGIPLMWLPWMHARTDVGIAPLKGVILGTSSRYGWYAGLRFGGSLGGEEPWGEWELSPQYRHRRGGGIGGDLRYADDGVAGRITAFYQRDKKDEDLTTEFPITNPNRGRVRWQHRQLLSEDFLGGRLSGIGEFAWLSDAGFLREYYAAEALEDKVQEDLLYLKLAGDEHAATLFGRWRARDFQTMTEYRPAATYDLFSLPIATDLAGTGMGVYLSGETQAAQVRRAFGDDSSLRGVDTTRFMGRGTVSFPLSLGPIRVVPEYTAGVTTYNQDQNATRVDLTGSVRIATDFWRTWPDVSSDTFDLSGLRHIVDVSVGWANRYAVTTSSRDLFVQDPIDLLDEFEAFDLRLRNRFETKRAGSLVTWIDLELRALFFPGKHPARPAPFGFREEWAAGMPALLVPGENWFREIDRQGWGPLLADMQARLREDLYFVADAWYDYETNRFETYSEGFRYEGVDDLSIFIGHRAIQGNSSIITGSIDIRLTDRWGVRWFNQTNLRGDDRLVTALTVRRFVHDFVFEVSVGYNSGEGNTAVGFSLEPIFLYESERIRERQETLNFDRMRWY